MRRRSFLATGTVPFAPASAAPPARQPWPVFDAKEEEALLAVLRAGRWNRGSVIQRFESEYAKATGAKGCIATANGTSALLLALHAMGIKPGDEVIVPPYTFVATINVVLEVGAIPVFVDTDPATFQVDARKISAAITPRTVAIMPVHLGGNVADLDAILKLAQERKIPVIEDACQAHMAEWRGRKVGSLGKAGCFSFQASKNLNSGEGGALLTNEPEFLERCYAFHNNGRGRGGVTGFEYVSHGLNLRMTEFQGALLLAQMSRLEEQMRRREQNAQYLTSMLKEIPGAEPAKMYDGCTRNAYHLYMFRWTGGGAGRNGIIKALRAAGLDGMTGYSPLNKQPFIPNVMRRWNSEAVVKAWAKRNECPENDRLCEQAIWFAQTTLLGSRSDVERIAEVVRKAG